MKKQTCGNLTNTLSSCKLICNLSSEWLIDYTLYIYFASCRICLQYFTRAHAGSTRAQARVGPCVVWIWQDVLLRSVYVDGVIFCIDGDTKFAFTLPLFRHILQKYGDFVPLATYVPQFPKRAPDDPDYEEKFLQCVDSDEFAALIKQQILPNMKKYEASL